MFNRKLKKRIAELEIQVSDYKNQISKKDTEIHTLKFQVENPPKYRVGDTVCNFVIISYSFSYPMTILNIVLDAMIITTFILYKRKNKNLPNRNELVKSIKNAWQYKVKNVNTGEIVNKNEYELILLEHENNER